MINEEKYLKIVCENIATKRKQKGVSQLDLAVMIGMEDSNLSRIERGHSNPTLRNLIKICNALEIRLKDLDIPD